jgi:ribosomal protein L11 methylase PrmA
MSDGPPSAASFRDPAGFVFEDDGCVFRQVNVSAREHYDHLMQSGLYGELTEAGLLIRHEEIDRAPRVPAPAYRVLRPVPLDFVSYPYEWSFGQLKDAALLTLAIQRRALRRGMSLKDASAYNVQFHEGRPCFIDTLSFDRYREGEPWVAYRQFCQHFLAPLALMSLVDIRLGLLSRTYLDGVPLDLAARLLPRRSRLRFGLLLHVYLHSLTLGRAPADVENTGEARRFKRGAMLGLLDSLEAAVSRLHWRPPRSTWTSYYADNTYSDSAMSEKGRIVAGFLDAARPATAWDFGANTGRFSRLASDRGIDTVAFDIDPGCVELNYQEVKRRRETKLLPLLMDLLNPTPAAGWANRERTAVLERRRPDVVLALALIHHLAIAGNVPLPSIADLFQQLAPWLIVEFVPPEDPQVLRLVAQHRHIHHPYDRLTFERAFQCQYSIEAAAPIPESGRMLYLMRRLGDRSSNAR